MRFSTIDARRRCYCSVLCVLALGCALHAQEGPSDFDQLVAKAEAARGAGAADDAIRYYQGAVRIRPQWEEGWWYLGTLLYDVDRFADAVVPFQHVTELEPKLGPAWGFLGLCEFELGNDAGSLDHLQRAQQLGFAEDPELRKVALYHLTLLLSANSQFERATELLVSEFGGAHVPDQIRTAMGMALLRIPLLPSRLDPSKDALVQAAGDTATLLAARNMDAAFASFSRMLQEYPDTPYLHYAYGSALAAAGRNQEAEVQFREESRMSPKSPLPLIALASLAMQDKRPHDALVAAQQAKDLPPDLAAVHAALADAYQALGQTASATSERARQAELADRAPAIEASQVTRYSVHADTGLGAAAPAAANSPDLEREFQAAVRQGESAQNAGRLDEATNAYQLALGLRPDWNDAWRRLGTIAYMRGRYSEAAADLQKAVKTQPKQADAWTLLGLSEFEVKDYKNALLHLERGSELGFGANAAGVKFAKYHLALLLNVEGQFDRATNLLIPETNPGPLLQEIQFVLGLALLRIPLLPEQVNPGQRALVTQAGELAGLLSQRHYDEAFSIFEAMLREHPDTPFLHYAYGASLANISEFERAEVQLREEIRLNPDSPLPYVRLASVLVAVHQPESAMSVAKQAVALAPRSPDAHYILGRSALELGTLDVAIAELEVARQLAPGSPAVHFNLARAYSKAKRFSDAERERAEFERLNQMMVSQDPAQRPAQGLSQTSEGIADRRSTSPR